MVGKYTLKDIRKSLGYTQSGFGVELGLTRSSIAKKEMGLIAMTVDDLLILRDKFGIDLNELKLTRAEQRGG